jgi:hypothetical protein
MYLTAFSSPFVRFGQHQLLQGLNARLELINKHPFYNQQAFDQFKGSGELFFFWLAQPLLIIMRAS